MLKPIFSFAIPVIVASFLFILPAYPQNGPVISGVNISAITHNSATINWTTNVLATGRIEHGETTSYGKTTAYSRNLAKTHKITISSLKSYTTYHCRIIAKDRYGATSTSQDFTFTTKDPYPPTGTVQINNNAPYTNSLDVTLKISATDTGGSGLDKMQFSNDNKTWFSPIPYAAEANWRLQEGLSGTRWVYSRFIDKSGNISSAVNDTITLDITKPTGTIKINNNAPKTSSLNVTLNITATDTYSGVNTTYGKMCFSNDNITYTEPEAYKTTKPWQLLAGPDGERRVYAKFCDRAGNWSNAVSASIVLDTIGPAISNINPASITHNSATIKWNTDESASCQLQYGETDSYSKSTTFGSFATQHTITISSLKTYTTYHFRIIAKDRYGATSTSQDFTFTTKDPYPPTGTVQINNNAPYTNSLDVTLKISATDTGGSGLDKMQFSNDNKTWSSPTPYAEQASWRLQEGKDGNRYVYTRFIDKSGNISAAVSDSIYLETVPPTGRILINNNTPSTATRNVTLTLTAQDNYSGMAAPFGRMCFSNDNITYTGPEAYKTTKAWQLTKGSGIKTVYVKYQDRASNWSLPISDTIEYISPDNIPPTGTITINSSAAYANSRQVTLTPYAQDNPGGSGLDTMSFSNDGINYSQPQAYSASPVSWTLAQGDGEKTVYVKYTDKEANTSAAFTDTIILDTTAPQIDFENIQNNMHLSGDIAVHVLLNDANKDYVEFYLNDILQHTDTEGTGGLYRWPWTTTDFNNGAYTLKVIGYDKAGNSSLRKINITVDNRDPLTKSYAFLYKQMDKYKQGSSLRLIESYSTPYPPNQQYTAWIYDNTLAIMALLTRKNSEDLQRAKILIQSLIWAQDNDPAFNDGRIRDAYWANNLQNPNGAAAKSPGSALGNLSWAVLALLDYYQNSQDSNQGFLNQVLLSAQSIADFILANYEDTAHPGFIGGFYDWDSKIYTHKSLENNTAFYTACVRLYDITSNLNYLKAAKNVRAFIEYLYNSTDNMFYCGTLADGWTINQTYNKQVLDCQTLSLLATGQYDLYPVLSWIEINCGLSIDGFSGFDFNTDRDGIWFEGTAQSALLYKLFSNATLYQGYISEIEMAQKEALNTDGEGVISASHDGVTTNHGFEYYASPSLAATCWYILAKQGKNPLWALPVNDIRPIASITTDTQDIAAEEEISFSSDESYDPDGSIASYKWDFGDNTGSNQLSPTHAYSQAGTYKIVLTVTDNDGLKGYDLTVLEVSEADHTPPTGNISISNGAQYTNSATSVALNLTAQDNQGGSGIDKMRFSNNGQNWTSPEPYTETKSWTLTTGDGTKTVYAKFIDKKGNVSSAYSDSIVLDTISPDIIILSPLNNSTVNTKTITLQGTVDGVPFTEPRTLTKGTNTLTKTATDAAGNSASVSITITLDTTPPEIIITQPVDGAILNTPTITLQGTIDGMPFTEPRTLTEGTNTITKTAADAAGNNASATVTVTLDTIAPQIVITSPQNNSTVNTPTITLTGTIDGAPFTESRQLTEDANTITKTATDAAGNITSASITVTLDTTPPEIIITSPQANSIFTTPDIILEGTIDGAPFSESRTLQDVGENTVIKKATDAAGNKGSASVVVIYTPGKLIGPEGGEAVSFDGRIRLIIPEGALSEATYVNISSLDPTIFEGKMPSDYSSIVVVKCEPMGLVLLKEAQLIIKLDSQQVPGTEIKLGLYNYGLDEVELLGQLCPVASDGFTVNFTLWHFSEYFGLKNMVSQGAPIGAGVQVPLPDLLTGSYSYEVPITVPPGRAKMQPSISLSYNSSNSNSWVGYGWNLNPGYIMRSTKHGIPSYNDTKDAFILVSGNSSTELIHLVDNLYQARVESDFTKFFKEADDSWKIIQKDGTVLRFGASPDSKETSQSGTFSWHLTKVIDNNGNYISLSYTKDESKSYLSRIEYTGNENTYFAPTHSVNFYLEDRNDVISSYISGSKILMKKRLKTIEVLVGYNLIWQYELNYEYAPETDRSLLKSIQKFTSDNKSFPEQKFYYQNHDGRQQ